MSAKIQGLVLRSTDTKKMQEFYSNLGIEFKSHSHGGPIHSECQNISDIFAVEIYKASATFYQDAIIVQVDSLENTLAIVKKINAPILQPTKETSNMKFAYISDPDGRPILLLEMVLSK